ncbi:MAG: 50S ribosomal protein L25 [Dehalococcoidia bacterium]|jgi:large subunit ribosomal protein L25|nr:50S ribosomal protein L25 [Dehalococcoidia bacterium]MDP7084287.1 50S ribosomal protein L25 [Dehalococcoidia bacterium]MDP7201345.1 50S ribosomal protein L25 [Dehalococcoidia bacterium]MDP7511443.1 50S ribosomal protein L25 [Dehalococcoidia bacterium]HJN88336.1 50S ribosomal protein L25 [Dehalococcoidia bacterium]
MTSQAIKLELEPRDTLGKKVKQLRRLGIIPVHLYGPGVESRALQCQAPKLVQALVQAGGSTPITVSVRGEKGDQLAFAREIQWDPRRDDLLHVDLLVAEVSKPVRAQVPITLTGESPGAKMSGGTIMHQLHELDVEALPLEMPSHAEVDLNLLTDPDGVVRAGDIQLPGNVTVLTDPDDVVVRIEQPRVAAEEEAVSAEEAGADETPADGESPDAEA